MPAVTEGHFKLTTTILPDLFQSVLQRPDDDAPRLAYADACAVAGDHERAEFIRLQLDTTTRMRAGRDDAWELDGRARSLLDVHRDAWARAIGARVEWCGFYRGFVEAIQLDAAKFLACADELYQLAPIRRLILTGVSHVVDALFSSPHLARIVSLSVARQELGDRGVELLANSPYLGKLASLDLRWNGVTLNGIEAMAASSKLPALISVSLWGNPASSASEAVGIDGVDGRTLFPHGSEDGSNIEAKYGRKRWLHTVEDHGRRELNEAEL